MMLSHRIRLEATPTQAEYFARAAGTSRRVWNWALAEYHRQMADGHRPNIMALKRQFNALKYSHPQWLDCDGKPWLRSIHRDAHAQPFAHLARTWGQFFAARNEGKTAHPPVFKKKGRCRDSFYIANDRIRFEGKSVVLPKVGRVTLTETLRLPGKIMGANISRVADYWFLAVQVDVPDALARRQRSNDNTIGVDLGVTAAATLSNGEKIAAPRPLKAALRRLRIRSRRQSRKVPASSKIDEQALNSSKRPLSKNRIKGSRSLERLHARVARVRRDFLHKLTTRLCRENQTVAIETLFVKGMLSNARLARSIADVGFYEFRRQLQYKALRFDTCIVLADRWYPSSKLCSSCGAKNSTLKLSDRVWTCVCGIRHDRDVNAAINLERLATDALRAAMALPVASRAVTPGTAVESVPTGGGKVTLVRYEYGQQDDSGQEDNGVDIPAPNR